MVWVGGGVGVEGGLLQALEVRSLLRRLAAGEAGLAGEALVKAVASNSFEGGAQGGTTMLALCCSD